LREVTPGEWRIPGGLYFPRGGELVKKILGLACALALATAHAEQIVVSNYAVTTNGMPFAVAMEKGYFKEFKVDVDGILTSDGGGTTVRNLLGGKLSYGEAAVSAVVTVAEFVWVAMPKSPVNSLKDLKGRKLGYTNPRSTSQALAILLMETQKLKEGEVELVRTGGFGAGLTMLEIGGVDVVPVAEPLWSKNQGKYKLIAAAPDILPALSNVVGVTTGEAAKSKGDFIRGVIRARRKAVEFMYANPKESAVIIAKAYSLEVPVAESTVRNLLASEKKGGVPYWGPGDIRIDTMDNMIRAQTLVGAMKGAADWSKLIDEQFLPDDLKTKKK
jgi:NitT/TauT family transport system substrate-binding protein